MTASRLSPDTAGEPQIDLFESTLPGARQAIGEQAFVLRGFALPLVPQILASLADIERASPFRHMTTPGGFTMSVALTNCGDLGWTTDRRGYRYTRHDPQTGAAWPALPHAFSRLAGETAAQAGFQDFSPDACLINRYEPGARLSLHQDKDEAGYDAPIVSVSLGIPAIFLFGGHRRSDRSARIPLAHGDVVVWGGIDRMRYHGIAPIAQDRHPLLDAQRINLTFRKAG
ncbi:MAG: DNA oxidative demethylase AlkB [Gammaproteobacteria bacterium]